MGIFVVKDCMDSSTLIATLNEFKQNDLVARLKSLPSDKRLLLETDLINLDWQSLNTLLANNSKSGEQIDNSPLQPIIPYQFSPQKKDEIRVGEEALSQGHLALFTVAGGQGSRLGLEGPKGCFGVTPIRKHSLFKVFAQKILVAQRKYSVEFPWVIMTSAENNSPTRQFFEKNDYFGLKKEQIFFFIQGVMPVVDARSGALLMASDHHLKLCPDGTGGAFKGLKKSGILQTLRGRGITLLSYFQVDNPLVRPVDPAFIGAHLRSGSQYSAKSVVKIFPEEKVGIFAKKNGKVCVVEYIDLPPTLAGERNDNGSLTYAEGNTAITLIDLEFIQTVADTGTLAYHRAFKKESYWTDTPSSTSAGEKQGGRIIFPNEPNAHKFEQFVFGALPLARNVQVIRVHRADEFSPVKNASGADSPETCRVGQLNLWASWLRDAGVKVPLGTDGVPSINFEISPLFADDLPSLLERKAQGKLPTAVTDGLVLE